VVFNNFLFIKEVRKQQLADVNYLASSAVHFKDLLLINELMYLFIGLG
jgi:hypothetical protein